MDRPLHFLAAAIGEFDQAADLAVGVEHHVPGQVRDLASPQPGLGRQQDQDLVAERVPGTAGEHEEVADV